MMMKDNFSVVYSFKVKEGKQDEFIQNWKKLTALIYENAGSLGSRLHQVDQCLFMAYALWPDRNTFKEANKLPIEAEEIREKQKSCVEEFKIVYQSHIVADLIKSNTNNIKLDI